MIDFHDYQESILVAGPFCNYILEFLPWFTLESLTFWIFLLESVDQRIHRLTVLCSSSLCSDFGSSAMELLIIFEGTVICFVN